MKFYTYFLAFLFLFINNSSVIPSDINLNANLRFPLDSLDSQIFLKSLNSFLNQKEKSNKLNSQVNPTYISSTSILLDELKGIDLVSSSDTEFQISPYLNNIVKIDDNSYLLSFSYFGYEDTNFVTKLQLKLIANKIDGQYLFSSPLDYNLYYFDTYNTGDLVVKYASEEINKEVINSYSKYIMTYDSIIGNRINKTQIYVFKNASELFAALGIDYSNKFNGYSQISMSSLEDSKYFKLIGYRGLEYFNKFDPHDLWHERLRLSIDRGLIYKPVDEGCAFLFGGSWGYTWEDIVGIFREKYSSKKKYDWYNLYLEGKDFGIDKSKPLKFDYFINALIVQKMNEDEGFDKIKKLLTIGKEPTSLDVYFNKLDELMGINKGNFNSEIDNIISEQVYNTQN